MKFLLYAYLSRKSIKRSDAKISRTLCCFNVTVEIHIITKNAKDEQVKGNEPLRYFERVRAICALRVSSTWIEGHTFVGVSV